MGEGEHINSALKANPEPSCHEAAVTFFRKKLVVQENDASFTFSWLSACLHIHGSNLHSICWPSELTTSICQTFLPDVIIRCPTNNLLVELPVDHCAMFSKMLIYVPHVVCVVSKILLIVHVVVCVCGGGGVRDVGGRGEISPQLLTILNSKESLASLTLSSFALSSLLPSDWSCGSHRWDYDASPLCSSPRGGLCRCHGWPALEEEEEKEEGQNRGFLISFKMTFPASLNVLEKSTLALLSSLRD